MNLITYDPYRSKDPVLFFRNKNRELFAFERTDLFVHTLLAGVSGCGKTTVIRQALPQIRSDDYDHGAPYALVIFDPKGEFADDYYRPGDYVLGAGGGRPTVSWNIFREVMADTGDMEMIRKNAREIAHCIFKNRGSATQPFFADAAENVFYGVLIFFALEVKNGNFRRSDLNNNLLVRFLSSRQMIENAMSRYGETAVLLEMISKEAPGTAANVYQELLNALNDCFTADFRGTLPYEQGFSVREAVRRKDRKAIFMEYDINSGEAAANLYGLLVDLAIKESLSHGGKKGAVYMFLDELPILPPAEHLNNALNFGRSFGLSIFAAIQNVNQLYDKYGEARGQVVLGGFRNLLCFNASDHTSAEYLSHALGSNYYSRRVFYRDGTVGEQAVQGYNVEMEDIQRLGRGQAYVRLESAGPVPFFWDFAKDL